MARLANAMALLRRALRATRLSIQDILIILGLFLLPLVFFWPVTVGHKTLLPLDNLLTSEPLASYAQDFDVATRQVDGQNVVVPKNGLLSDLVLENYVWKSFILQSLREGELPLWNPQLFAGVPFLAAGQHSALYPLSILFYILPLTKAYGWFMVFQFFLTGLFTYIYMRTIRVNRFGATVAAITYTFSLFMTVSVVFPMIIAALSWLPLLLTAIELVVRRVEATRQSPAPYVTLGAVALGLEWFAGHVEITYFVLIVMALYAAWRLAALAWRRWGTARPREALAPAMRAGLWLFLMVILGTGLGAIQVVPLYELVRTSFRQGSVTLQQVLEWAYPKRRILAFLMPDLFGNPTHHSYFDILSRTVVNATRNYAGQAITTIEWGIKNYVEGSSYVGILPLLLALVALIGKGRRHQAGSEVQDAASPPEQADADALRGHVWFYAVLSLFSLALVFGTPLYALIYHLPGLSQSHSPFRWVFPFVFSVSVMAGVGAWYLSGVARQMTSANSPLTRASVVRWLGWGGTGLGALILVGLGASTLFPNQVIPLAERVMLSLAKAPEAFDGGRMFYSYEFRNVAIFSGLVLASGVVLRLSGSRIYLPKLLGRYGLWKPLALVVLVGDLFLLGRGFYPTADPRILDVEPPVIRFLKQDPELYRITTYDTQSTKPLPENEGMLYGLSDIRGYDSIIPKQYADFMGLIEDQGELLYNRIARLRDRKALTSPLLDLLNVKYVLTEETIDVPGYTLVYDGEVRVYRNDNYLPRAFAVYDAKVVPDEAALSAELTRFDPRQVALVDVPLPPLGQPTDGMSPADIQIASYKNNEVIIDAALPVTGVLVLADTYFPPSSDTFHTWKAYDTPGGATEEAEIPIYRTDGNFRGFVLGPGTHHLRIRFTPMSLKFGLFVSFLSAAILALVMGTWAWQRYYREDEGGPVVQRVAKNTGTSIVLSLMNRALDMAFAMFMLRVLGPDNAGKFTFAVVLVTWFEIVTNFGLNTLLTRDVARDRAHASRYLANTSVIRLGMCGLALPAMLALIVVWRELFGLSSDTAWAIVLLTIGLIPSGISSGLSAVFNAYEKMEYPAAISSVTTIISVVLRTLALFMGFGFVGLAGVSILVNLITMGVLYSAVSRMFFRPKLDLDWALQKAMLVASYPLMLNHLLATFFFKTDVTLLKAIKGDRAVGYYGTAYKPIDALLIIPSFFTMAVFPILSRYAANDREAMPGAYGLAIRFLLLLALPIMIVIFFAAEPIIRLLGGSAYLPDSMIALRLLILFLPLSYINGVTQYVLIALDQQRFLTRAYLLGVGFNLIANLIFIPRYGYSAAAIITVLSELALMGPFLYGVRRHMGPIPWLSLVWRPVVAAAAMTAVLMLAKSLGLLVTLPLSVMVYVGSLLLLGALGPQERLWLRRLIGREAA